MPYAVVTGAGGFAGRWLCQHLADAGVEVEGWYRRTLPPEASRLRARRVDICDAEAVLGAIRAASPSVVFHLAAMSSAAEAERDPVSAERVNVGGARAVATAAAAVGARLVLASSCHVYGSPRRLPVCHGHPESPSSVYGRTKLAAEREARAAGGDLVVVRAFHHLGPGQSRRFAVSGWAEQLAAGAASVRVGDLSLRRDYTDVRDIVAGYATLASEASSGDTIDLCSGRAIALGEVLRLLNGGTMPSVEVDQALLRVSEAKEITGAPGRAEALGWQRLHALEDTLEEVMAAARAPDPVSPRGCP